MQEYDITLLDDGTLDTVFVCNLCEQELRYSHIQRDAEGDIEPDELDRVLDEHAEECEAFAAVEWRARNAFARQSLTTFPQAGLGGCRECGQEAPSIRLDPDSGRPQELGHFCSFACAATFLGMEDEEIEAWEWWGPEA